MVQFSLLGFYYIRQLVAVVVAPFGRQKTGLDNTKIKMHCISFSILHFTQ